MKANTFPKNLTLHAKKVISLSQQAAIELRSPVVQPLHILLGLLDCEKGLVHTLLTNLSIPIKELRDTLKTVTQHNIEQSGTVDSIADSIAFSKETEQLFMKVANYANRLKNTDIDTDHIFVILLRYVDLPVDLPIKSICKQYKLNYTHIKSIVEETIATYQRQLQEQQEAKEYILEQVKTQMQAQANMSTQETSEEKSNNQDTKEVSGTWGRIADHIQYLTTNINLANDSNVTNYTETPVLDSVSKDLSKLASEGKIDPPIGRDQEIERIAQILSRRKKNNALLIGEPGVGKTAIAEGLALKILHQDIATSLLDKRVVSLDVTSLVAGTKYRGQFEERIQTIINELIQSKQIILFIDEIHTIVGSGSISGALDLANILKPALARGEIQCIGATTISEYRNYLEKDGALARRFQNIIVSPTTVSASIDILQHLKPFYETQHAVTYSKAILKACVELSERYIPHRPLPDKALDIMDEVGAMVHMRYTQIPARMLQIQEDIKKLKSVKALFVKEQEYEIATKLREEEQALALQFELTKKKWQKGLQAKKQPITIDDLAKVIANITQIPTERIIHKEDKVIRNLKHAIQAEIIGQDEAIEKIVKTVHRTHLGLQDPNRPLGVFMFLGPTGVGKTALAKSLAIHLFAKNDRLIRIDMSEYMEKIAVTRLIGAPPGYVGYEAGGQLTEKIRNNPYSVILLDEIEKAHSDVFNILLQMMDDGVLTDGLGRTINCKHAIIIMSSNVGASDLSTHKIGFQHSGQDIGLVLQEQIQKNLKSTFRPEFINRLDDVIIFKTLSIASVQQIVDIQLQQLRQRIKKLGYRLVVSPQAKNFIAEKGYNILYGARPIKRVIQQHIEDMIATHILDQHIKAKDTIYIDHVTHSEKLSLTVNTKQ